MYASCHAHGARVLAITCLEADIEVDSEVEAQRRLLNGMVREACSGADPGLVLCDLEASLPLRSMDPDEAVKVWDDGLHLTAAGYDRMAGHLFDALRPHLLADAP